jgi:hypothetical protein
MKRTILSFALSILALAAICTDCQKACAQQIRPVAPATPLTRAKAGNVFRQAVDPRPLPKAPTKIGGSARLTPVAPTTRIGGTARLTPVAPTTPLTRAKAGNVFNQAVDRRPLPTAPTVINGR